MARANFAWPVPYGHSLYRGSLGLLGRGPGAVHVELELLRIVLDRDLDRVGVDPLERERERAAIRRREAIRTRLRDGILPAHLHALDREVPFAFGSRPRAASVDLNALREPARERLLRAVARSAARAPVRDARPREVVIDATLLRVEVPFHVGRTRHLHDAIRELLPLMVDLDDVV